MMKLLLTTLNSKYIHSNLAVKYLYQAAREFHDELEVKEYTINNEEDSVYVELIRGQYDLVCFSCYIWNIRKILYLADNLKKACPHVSILLGGPEVSFEVGELLESHRAVDFVLAGEGEETFPLFLAAFGKQEGQYAGIPGLSYREKGQLHIQAPAAPVDFSAVPFVYEQIPCEKDRVIYYESTRGCPYRCAYCLSCLEKDMRPLPVERVKRDLTWFLKQNVKQVKLIDRTFNYDKKRAMELIAFLIQQDNGVTNFHLELCGDLMDEDFVSLIATARPDLFQFEIGVQSTNVQTLSACNRTGRTEKMGVRIRQLRELDNVRLHLDLIAGLPYEGYESFGVSFDQVYAMKPHELQLGFLKLLKGTPFRQMAKEYGMVYRAQAPYEVIETKWITAMEMVGLKQIETVWNLYGNRGGFEKTIAFVVTKYEQSPFHFFEELGNFYYEMGWQDRSHKKEDLYRMFFAFAMKKQTEGESKQAWGRVATWDGEKIRSLLAVDMNETLNFDAVKKFEKKGWGLSL